jgi:lipoyl synthase
MKTKFLPRIQLTKATSLNKVRTELYSHKLHSVCYEARCPNQAHCADNHTATFMILGNNCTRNCHFCAVKHGKPKPIDENEPLQLLRTVKKLSLEHVVITSVTRDDLMDGGAEVFCKITKLLKTHAHVTVELLVPDFKGSEDSISKILDSGLDVINHNLETVQELYPILRSGADYNRSLKILEKSRKKSDLVVKTGIMIGLGETIEQLENLFRDIAETGCQAILIGQYLRPDPSKYAVRKYFAMNEISDLAQMAQSFGIQHVIAGPLVRSSYRARNLFEQIRARS